MPWQPGCRGIFFDMRKIKIIPNSTDEGLDVQIVFDDVDMTVAIDVFGEKRTMVQVLVYNNKSVNSDEYAVAVRPCPDGTTEVCMDRPQVYPTHTDDSHTSPWMLHRDGI